MSHDSNYRGSYSAAFQLAIQRILRPQPGPIQNPTLVYPHVTSDIYRSGSEFHRGIDFNYVGGQLVGNPQTLNVSGQKAVYAPVTGTVVALLPDFGGVIIQSDTDGTFHRILHLDGTAVSDQPPNNRVVVGETQIGTMGGRGPSGPTEFDVHVHYDGDLVATKGEHPAVDGGSMTSFRFLSSILFLATVLLQPLNAGADGKYDRDRICTGADYLACDLLVERAVAADVPDTISRTGLILRIQARNDKTIERKSTDPKTSEESSQHVWACDYFSKYHFVRLCYRFSEGTQTEYVNIETGESVVINGLPRYSPSGQRALFIDGYAGEVSGIEIWRFEKSRLVNEFRFRSPPQINSDFGNWKSETEVVLASQFRADVVRHRLVKQEETWILRGP